MTPEEVDRVGQVLFQSAAGNLSVNKAFRLFSAASIADAPIATISRERTFAA
jgi:hypothetical protein